MDEHLSFIEACSLCVQVEGELRRHVVPWDVQAPGLMESLHDFGGSVVSVFLCGQHSICNTVITVSVHSHLQVIFTCVASFNLH